MSQGQLLKQVVLKHKTGDRLAYILFPLRLSSCSNIFVRKICVKQNWGLKYSIALRAMISTLRTRVFAFCAFLSLVTSVIVSTNYGDVEGLVVPYPSASGPFKSVSKFLGVPFAAPPIGELRLKAPEPPQEWKPNVRLAKKHGYVCWQDKRFEHLIKLFDPNFSFSEDCLYLDVYSPNVRASLPVMVYIHGGSYELGTAVLDRKSVV